MALVDEERIDELLKLVSVDGIAAAWCRASSSADEEGGLDDDNPDWWSIQLWMSSSWWRRRDLVREGLLALLERADDPDVLAHVAAGPLETFIDDSEDDLAWLEEQAECSPRFREALKRVWIWDHPPEVFDRVERAAGGPLPRPNGE